MFETAKLVHRAGLKNIVVSNGYINPEPLQNILPYIDAFNIDLKAFSNDFYVRLTKGKLSPVLETIKIIAKSNSHLEITNLVIPDLNDSEVEFEEMVKWIAGELGTHIPLHLSRYFPKYNLHLPPTPVSKLERFYEIAKTRLQFVYLGNVNDEKRSATFCPKCNETLITRDYYFTEVVGIDSKKCCKFCGTEISLIA
jgi:pyruvate formate lyase activating enzyme